VIDLVLIPHPLRPGEARAQLPGPMRLDALMREAWAGRLGSVPVSVWVDGEPAASADWRRIEVADGAAVTIRPALAGGDTNPLRVVLQLALAVGTAGLLGSGWYAAAGWLARGAAVGGLLVGGNLLVNAVAPPRLPELAGGPKAEPLYALSGGSNRARPWEPLLMVLGERRVFPDLAAAEYTEFRGGQMHLSQLFSFGVGDLEIDDLRLGDTPLADYEEVETELLAPGDGPTLVWSNVDTSAGAELDDAQPVVRRSGAGAARLAVDFVGQIFAVDKKGRYKARAAAVRVDIAEVGGSGSASETVTLRGDGPGAVRVTVELDLPGQGAQWDVTVRRLAAPSQDERVRDAVTWTALRTYQAAAGDASSSTRLAVRVRATGQLNGRLDRLSAIVRCKAPVWRAGAWTADAEATSNPAALARLFALGVWHGGELAGGTGLAPERVDDERLGEWFEFCAGEGFRCDLAAQGRQSRAQLLRSILQCGRADASWATGKFGAVWEDEADEVAGMITPGNVVAGSMQVDWAGAGQLAQEFVGRYTDAASGWREAEVRRLMPGVSSPTRAAEVALHGVTRAEHAAREVNMLASAQLHRRRAIKWRMSLEGLAAARGSRWWIAHSLVDGGETGRLAGGDESNLALDRPIEVGSGSWLAVRLPDGRLHASRISTAPGETAKVELADPLPASPSAGGSEFEDSLWRHYDSADPPAPVRITGVRPGADHTVEITAVDDPPEYYAADTADLSASLLPRLRPPPAVVAGAVTEAVRRTGLGYSVTLSIALEVSGDWRGGTVLAAADGGDTRQVASMADGETSASWPAPAKGSVEITVVPGSAAAPAGSPWTTTHVIRGVAVRPAAPADLAVRAGAYARAYSWTPPDDEDVVGVRIRHAAAGSAAYADMDALHEGLLPASPWESAAPGAGDWDFAAVAVAASGLESAPAYVRAVTLAAIQRIEAGEGVKGIARDSSTGEWTVTYLDGSSDSFSGGREVTGIARKGDKVIFSYSDSTTVSVPLRDGDGIDTIRRDPATGIVTVTLDSGLAQTFSVKDGAPGGLSEWIYRSTDSEDDPSSAPAVPATSDADRKVEDFVPAGWSDDPVEGKYTWVSKRSRKTGAEAFSEFSAAVRHRGDSVALKSTTNSDQTKSTNIITTTNPDDPAITLIDEGGLVFEGDGQDYFFWGYPLTTLSGAGTDAVENSVSGYAYVAAAGGYTLKVEVRQQRVSGDRAFDVVLATGSATAVPSADASKQGLTITTAVSAGLTAVAGDAVDGRAEVVFTHESGLRSTVHFTNVYLGFADGASAGGGTAPSPPPPPIAPSTAVPGKPGIPTVDARGHDEIEISWTAPSDNGGAAITGYRVRWRSGQGSYTTSPTLTATSYTIPNLSPSTAYSIQVEAINSEGAGQWSNARSASTTAAPTPQDTDPPNEPSTPTLVSRTTTTLIIATVAPSSGPAAAGYKWRYSTDRTITDTDPSKTTTDPEVTLTGLNAASTYFIDVAATNTHGSSSYTADLETSTLAAVQTPSAPRNVLATPDGQNALDIAWDAPASAGGAPITDYDIQYRAGNSGSWSAWPHSGTGRTSEITGLTAGTQYSVQVRASNSEGAGGWSGSATGTTAVATPPPDDFPTVISAVHNVLSDQFTITLRRPRADEALMSRCVWHVNDGENLRAFGLLTFPRGSLITSSTVRQSPYLGAMARARFTEFNSGRSSAGPWSPSVQITVAAA